MTKTYSEKEISKLYYSIPKILKKYSHLSTKKIEENERKFLDIYDIKEKFNGEEIYHYFRWSKKLNGYSIKKKTYPKAKLFISKKYVKNNLLKNIKNLENIRSEKKISLEEHEKFKIKNVIYEVDVRGERKPDKIYFNASDIGKILNNKNVNRMLYNSDEYELDTHYVILKQDNSVKTKKYFTYKGLYKYVINSTKKNSEYIFDKIEDIMSIEQIENKEQKLSSKIFGVSLDTLQLLSSITTTLPCIYLFTLGTVGDLRESMSIDNKHKDNKIVCKYGFTNDLFKRAKQHSKSCSHFENITLRLKYYRRIDNIYLQEATEDIRKTITSDKKLECDIFKELFVISVKKLKTSIKKKYNAIEKDYCDKDSSDKDVSDHIKSLKLNYEKKIVSLKHKLTIKNMQIEIDNLKNKQFIKDLQIKISNLKNKA